MDAETIASWAFGIAVLAFLWNLHRDIGLLRKDMRRDISHVREDLGRDISHVREALGKDISDLRDRVSRVEGMLAGAGLKIGSDPESR